MSRLAARGEPCSIERWLLTFATFLWIADAGSATGQEQSALAKRLFAEAPQAWEQQQDFFLTLEGSIHGELRLWSGGKWTITKSRNSWKQCNGNMLDQFQDVESGAGKGSVRGLNSEYSFILARDSETKPWVITSLKKNGEISADRWKGRKTFCQDLLVAVRTEPLPELFHSSGFKCISVTPEPTNAEDLVRVTFTFTPEGVNRLKSGWVVLDPSHYWVIRSSEVDLDIGEGKQGVAKWTVKLNYKEGSNHHPVATRWEMKGKIWEKDRLISQQEYLNDYDYRERPSIPESEFTLRAFDLPEPPWATGPKQTRWYLWAGLAGVLCLVGGAIVYQRKRRAGVVRAS